MSVKIKFSSGNRKLLVRDTLDKKHQILHMCSLGVCQTFWRGVPELRPLGQGKIESSKWPLLIHENLWNFNQI